MSFVRTSTGGNESVHKFVEALRADFKTLSLETKKKYPLIKEVRKLTYIHIKLIEQKIHTWAVSNRKCNVVSQLGAAYVGGGVCSLELCVYAYI